MKALSTIFIICSCLVEAVWSLTKNPSGKHSSELRYKKFDKYQSFDEVPSTFNRYLDSTVNRLDTLKNNLDTTMNRFEAFEQELRVKQTINLQSKSTSLNEQIKKEVRLLKEAVKYRKQREAQLVKPDRIVNCAQNLLNEFVELEKSFDISKQKVHNQMKLFEGLVMASCSQELKRLSTQIKTHRKEINDRISAADELEMKIGNFLAESTEYEAKRLGIISRKNGIVKDQLISDIRDIEEMLSTFANNHLHQTKSISFIASSWRKLVGSDRMKVRRKKFGVHFIVDSLLLGKANAITVKFFF